uniref:FAR1 domain-containing protein n=1 Tax=Aegilops tauschii subsp. strangulata TaxID=200361 RepID=A0A453SQQ2_AEGTS
MRECLLLCEGRQMGKLLRVLRPPLPHPVSIGAACRSARGGGCGGAGQHPSLFTSHPALCRVHEQAYIFLKRARRCQRLEKRQPPSRTSTSPLPSSSPGRSRLRIGRAPPDRAPCAGRVTPLEETIRRCADKPSDNVIKPEICMSFDSLGEAYDFYNLYSWEVEFGIRYGKSRLNVERTKCLQEIVCGCSGKPEQQNSWSCRCECPAMTQEARERSPRLSPWNHPGK